jgi:hypothetical protein
MRIGILIIGSLIWSADSVRCRWRGSRLDCDNKLQVFAPIRYGRRSEKTGTYSMVFSMACSQATKLGVGLVVPVRAECRQRQHLIEEAQHLWAAEKNSERLLGVCSSWGKVCVLKHPKVDVQNEILQGWHAHIGGLTNYTALSSAMGEDAVLDPATGSALFNWPKDVATGQPLSDFDLLLMTANEPTLNEAREYAAAEQIASAWRADATNNGRYFYNNRHYGITTFEDGAIQQALRGDPPNNALPPAGISR